MSCSSSKYCTQEYIQIILKLIKWLLSNFIWKKDYKWGINGMDRSKVSSESEGQIRREGWAARATFDWLNLSRWSQVVKIRLEIEDWLWVWSRVRFHWGAFVGRCLKVVEGVLVTSLGLMECEGWLRPMDWGAMRDRMNEGTKWRWRAGIIKIREKDFKLPLLWKLISPL